MQNLTQILDRLLDKQLVTAFLRQHVNPNIRDQIPHRVILDESQLAHLKSSLKRLPDHGKVGLVGTYKQRLLVCDTSCLPESDAEEGMVEFDCVRFTFHKSLPAIEDWKWLPTSERSWLDYRHEDTQKKEPGYAALSAYETLWPQASLTIDQLEPLIFSARSKYWVSWSIGVPLLSKLAAKNNLERECILRFARDPERSIRQRALRLISYHIQRPLALEVARILLPDRSKVVREKAAYFCEKY